VSRSPRRARARGPTLACALLLALAPAAPSTASPETLKRAASNLLFGPVDMALGPIVGTRAVYTNIQDIDDSPAVRAAYVLPGVVWNSAFCIGGGTLRLMSGLIELVPGLFLLPFEADLDPIYAPAEKSDALIWEEFRFLNVKLGVDYTD
jgi:hypothetical protein